MSILIFIDNLFWRIKDYSIILFIISICLSNVGVYMANAERNFACNVSQSDPMRQIKLNLKIGMSKDDFLSLIKRYDKSIPGLFPPSFHEDGFVDCLPLSPKKPYGTYKIVEKSLYKPGSKYCLYWWVKFCKESSKKFINNNDKKAFSKSTLSWNILAIFDENGRLVGFRILDEKGLGEFYKNLEEERQ